MSVTQPCTSLSPQLSRITYHQQLRNHNLNSSATFRKSQTFDRKMMTTEEIRWWDSDSNQTQLYHQADARSLVMGLPKLKKKGTSFLTSC